MPFRPEYRVLLDLHSASNKSGQIVELAVVGTGMNSEDFALASMIGLREPVTPTELSREFGNSLSTILFRASRSVRAGFVERVANPQDGRSYHLRLTPAGHAAWAQGSQNLHRFIEGLEQRLERPLAEVQHVLLELQAAFDAQVAEEQRG
jgi:DNA-binding MarR family transcriptional regulator